MLQEEVDDHRPKNMGRNLTSTVKDREGPPKKHSQGQSCRNPQPHIDLCFSFQQTHISRHMIGA